MSTVAHDSFGAQPVEVGRAVVEYPFRTNGDTSTKTIKRNYRQAPGYFTPAPLVSPDAQFPDAYLVGETDPAPTATNLDAFTRTFATVPADQITYGSRVLTKPAPSTLGTSIGAVYDYTASTSAVQLGTATNYLTRMWLDNKIYSYAAGTSSLTPATGGTFTVTYETSTTTALAYNAAGATIAAAINALADIVADGITVSCTNAFDTINGYLAIVLTAGTTTSLFSVNPASLTPAAATSAFNYYSATTSQVIYLGHFATSTAHGLTGGLPLAAVKFAASITSIILLPSTQWAVIDANTVALNPVYLGSGFATAYGQYLRAYTPGTDRVGIRQTQKFYLPGITSGIATPTAIPIPTVLLNDAEFLAAVVAYTSGYQTYDATELLRWNDWPIYTQTLIEVNMADV